MVQPSMLSRIDDSFDDAEVIAAFRRRVQDTAEWREHEIWHAGDPERRGEARIVTSWDDDAEETAAGLPLGVRAADVADDTPEPRRKREPLWAGCTCENPSLRIAFGEHGELRNELPAVIETNAYGVAAADEAVSYLESNPSGSVDYRPGTGVQTPSYGPGNALYK
jgi:hypothetical protein